MAFTASQAFGLTCQEELAPDPSDDLDAGRT